MVQIESFPKGIIDEMMQAFKNIAPVRVVINIANLNNLPTEIPENVMTQYWLNQIQVLN